MIEKLNTHYSFTTPASVHDEEALTALELAGRQGKKINEIIEDQNRLREDTPGMVDGAVLNHINNGTFAREIDHYIGGLSARVDTLLGSVGEGSTTLDAELIDIRTGFDGQPYDNAGNAVRKQFLRMAAQLADKDPYPTIVIDDIVEGQYFSTSNGGYGDGELWRRSRYLIPCPEHVMFYSEEHDGSAFMMGCYDKNLNYLGTCHIQNHTNAQGMVSFTMTGTKFIGITISATNRASKLTLHPIKPPTENVIEWPFNGHKKNYLYFENYYCNGSGNIAPTTGWNCIIIPAKGLSHIYTNCIAENPGKFYVGNNGFYAFEYFDSVNQTAQAGRNIIVPDPAVFIAINIINSQWHWNDQNHLSQYFALHYRENQQPLHGKNILCVGDSITWYDGNFSEPNAAPFVGWPAELRKRGAFVDSLGWSGACVTPITNATVIKPHVQLAINEGRVDLLKYNAVVLFVGTNDVYLKADINQFKQSFEETAYWFLQQNATLDLYIVNIMPSYGGERTNEEIQAFNTAIKEICDKWHFYHIDLCNGMSANQWNFNVYFMDTVHPNSRGYKRIGNIIANHVEKITGGGK